MTFEDDQPIIRPPDSVTVPEKDERPVLWLPDGRALGKPPIGFIPRDRGIAGKRRNGGESE